MVGTHGLGTFLPLFRGRQLKGSVTAGDWLAEKIVRIDTARREVYLIGHGREKEMNPYYACLYKAELDGNGSVQLLTPEDANHNVTFSPSGEYFTDNFSRVDLAPRSVLRNRNGKLIRTLAEADLSTLLATAGVCRNASRSRQLME